MNTCEIGGVLQLWDLTETLRLDRSIQSNYDYITRPYKGVVNCIVSSTGGSGFGLGIKNVWR